MKMNITIKHDQNSIDPGATCSDEQFECVIDALENEYQRAIRAVYPDAEIDFIREDYCGKSVEITDSGLDDPCDDEDAIQAICELVYETGNFWV